MLQVVTVCCLMLLHPYARNVSHFTLYCFMQKLVFDTFPHNLQYAFLRFRRKMAAIFLKVCPKKGYALIPPGGEVRQRGVREARDRLDEVWKHERDLCDRQSLPRAVRRQHQPRRLPQRLRRGQRPPGRAELLAKKGASGRMQRPTELVPISWCGVKASEGFGKLRKVAAFRLEKSRKKLVQT